MHKTKNDDNFLRTDLLYELENDHKNIIEEELFKGIKVIESTSNNNLYSTIIFNDITDQDNYYKVQNIFIKELKKYLKLSSKDKILIIGLGNNKSTPDSLGPSTIERILVTRHLYLLGELDKDYSNVASFSPNVTGNTGIETSDIIKNLIKEIDVNKVLVVDSLKTSSLDRLTKTIQITNQGISPGSGIGNTRKEISKDTMGIDVIAIGVPTVVDIKEIIGNQDNCIVTPTNIDFMIERLSSLIGNGINISLHKSFSRQNNYH